MVSSPTLMNRRDRMAWRSAAVAAAALALGVLTAYGQRWLPSQMGSLANSTGSWMLTACGLSLLAPSARSAAAFGCVSLVGLLAGYVLGAQMLGYPTSHATVLFWGCAAIVAGPVLGLCAYWAKTRRDRLAAIGVGVISGVLVGEGIYGLTRIAYTTYVPYWWGEVLVGLALLLVVAWGRLADVRTAVIAVIVAALVALAFVVAYSAGPGALTL